MFVGLGVEKECVGNISDMYVDFEVDKVKTERISQGVGC